MKYDYIEIGTSDFDLLCVKNKDKKGISVEPVRYYFERIPNIEGNTKAHAAISREYRICDVYYVPPDVMKIEKLPNWARGYNMDKVIGNFSDLGYKGAFSTRNDYKLVYGQV